MAKQVKTSNLPSRVTFASDEVVEALSNQERYHYEKALMEMYESFKIGALRIQLSGSETSEQSGSSESEIETSIARASQPSSGKGSYLAELGYHKRDKKKDNIRSKTGSKKLNLEVDVIYKELASISKGLKRESKDLREREALLDEKENHLQQVERELQNYEANIEKYIEEEAAKRLQEAELVLDQRLLQKSDETTKWKSSFKISKQANESLRKQLESVQEQCKVLEDKMSTLQTRLTNSQRKNEILMKHSKEPKQDIAEKESTVKKVRSRDSKAINSKVLETLILLLNWVLDTSLRHQSILDLSSEKQNEFDVTDETTRDRCRKVLPMLCGFLPQLTSERNDLQLSFLQFIHFAIVYLPLSQKGTHAATYRRIGEDLLRPQQSKDSDETEQHSKDSRVWTKTRDLGCDAFFLSRHEDTRIVSSLVILQTLSKVDDLIAVFEALKLDLRSETGKQIFLDHQGARVIHPFLKASNKAMLTHAVDVLMLLAIESPFLTTFLEALSNQQWITSLVILLQNKGLDVRLLEKLVIIFQKLSKHKSNKKFFDSLQVETMVLELIRTFKLENPFLTVNLQSTLFNLNAMKNTAGNKQSFIR